MQKEPDIANGEPGDFTDFLVTEVALKLQVNDFALILGKGFDELEYLADCLPLLEPGCDGNFRISQGCHSSLLLARIEGQVPAHREQPLREMSVDTRRIFLAQPEEGFLYDFPGVLQVRQNPPCVAEQGTLVEFQGFYDPSGFRSVAHAPFIKVNGQGAIFLDEISIYGLRVKFVPFRHQPPPFGTTPI